jgi:deoxyhypusine synthase
MLQVAGRSNRSAGSSGGGCSRSISMPGESKKSSQLASAGATTRRSPSRRITTSLTLAGNATSFGRRTACDRLLRNSVVRVMPLS